MLNRIKSLGYVEITPKKDFFIFKKNKKIRGHAFHYSEIIFDNNKPENFYTGNPDDKAVAFKKGDTLVSYVHLHFASLLTGSFSP